MNILEPQLNTRYCDLVAAHLKYLTVDTRDRSVGCQGNHEATRYVAEFFSAHKWRTEVPSFRALDWHTDGATLTAVDGTEFHVFASPYARGCDVHAPLTAVSTVEALEKADTANKLLLLHGPIAATPLMPKNFPFYSVEEHQKIIALLEKSDAVGIICATTRDSVAAGGVYPAPMIEDGDFIIPSVFTSQEEGERLLQCVGQNLTLISQSRQIPTRAANVIGRINEGALQRIVVTAHIDAKKGVPGALDNGTGIATLLLLSELLADYKGSFCIELVALNGEDHYAVPGQVAYMTTNRNTFDAVALNINVDGVGYIEGETAFSLFDLPADMEQSAEIELLSQPGACKGILWPQGDHSMFVQSGCPALAVTSNWLLENMAVQTITHTNSDNISLVAPDKVVSCAISLKRFIEAIS
ncbi:M28 family peptidase [Exilibacterium tricleocarpae]|uniref:M28 family peptidase n=1 Tax=Exilibacterium tricleocarpae TaxID=2591008 RepID=A0A545U995_9GAMM|nr:M28 family peptidase [Exilibacterium tricleocarpae]TQV86044.1 M28 family peptidase [Exilibacterium tricleocarpae]